MTGKKTKAGAEDLITAGRVAKLLRVSEGRVRQLALAGELVEAFRVGEGPYARRVYRRADVLAYAKKRTSSLSSSSRRRTGASRKAKP